MLREAGAGDGAGARRRAPRAGSGSRSGSCPRTRDPRDRVELLTALAGAHAATGRFEDSRAALLESIALTPDARTAARVGLIGACAGLEQLLGHHEAARTRLDGSARRAGLARRRRRRSSS